MVFFCVLLINFLCVHELQAIIDLSSAHPFSLILL